MEINKDPIQQSELAGCCISQLKMGRVKTGSGNCSKRDKLQEIIYY